jgi:hypothetical protein
MIRFAALVFLVACVPDPQLIGTPEWTVGTTGLEVSDLSATGEVVVYDTFETILFGADGSQRWRRTHPQLPTGFAIDHDGSVAALTSVDGQLSLARLDLAGQVEYERSVPEGTHEQAFVVIDARGVVWVVFNQKGSDQARWARFARDGSILDSGLLGFRIGPRPLAHPSRGMLVTSAQARLFEIGDGGEVLWMFDEPITTYTAHEDGELTLIVDSSIVRLSVAHEERWRRSSTMWIGEITAASGGSAVMFGEVDSLEGDGAIPSFLLVDRDGHASDRELVDGAPLVLVRGAPIDGFRFLTSERLLVARRLP